LIGNCVGVGVAVIAVSGMMVAVVLVFVLLVMLVLSLVCVLTCILVLVLVFMCVFALTFVYTVVFVSAGVRVCVCGGCVGDAGGCGVTGDVVGCDGDVGVWYWCWYVWLCWCV